MNRDELFRLLMEAAPMAGWSHDDPGIDVSLTSLDVILITSRLYNQYGIRIPPKEIKKERFRSAEAIWELCERLVTGG